MRILHCISSVNPIGGGPIEGIKRLGEALPAYGSRSEIVSLDSESDPWVSECPLVVHATGPSIGRYGYNTRFIRWLKTNAQNYDVVVINGLWQFSSFGAWRAVRKTQVPYVIFAHGMLDPWFKKRYPLKHLKKWLYWPFGDYRVIRDARAVIFTSDEERILARQSFGLYKAVERVVAYGTADPGPRRAQDVEAFLKSFPKARGKSCLLFLSRIHRKKGCDLLIRAFAKVASDSQDLYLIIAGPDATGWRHELEELARSLSVAPRIVWTGALSGPEKWGAFRMAQAFILPSHQENFGIAIAEALACGLPVLITDRVNIWREVLADSAGIVAADTQAGVDELIAAWLKMNENERARMSVCARECFQRRFEISGTARSFLDILAEPGLLA